MPMRNALELRLLVRCVLDESIATVAEEEFNRLCHATNNDFQDVAREVINALKGLRGLQEGVEPDYNEWVALFYLTWYQPHQINLALAILREMYEDAPKWLEPNFPLHIIDFGCGALAVQFALAILAAECQCDGDDLTVNGIDPSKPMKAIGKKLWLKFQSFLRDHLDLSNLSRICDQMTANCESFNSHTSYLCSKGSRLSVQPVPERWITAVHASYESNQIEIKRALQALRDQYSPTFTIVTSHRLNADVVRFVAREGSQRRGPIPELLPFQGQLPQTTEWRAGLLRRLPEYPIYRFRGLLRNSVEWAPSNHRTTVCRILGGG